MKGDFGSESPLSVHHFHRISRVVTASTIDARYTLLECSNQLITVGEREDDAVVASSFGEAASVSDGTQQAGAISDLHWHMASFKKATSLDDAVDVVPVADGCLSFKQPARGQRLNLAILKTRYLEALILKEFSLAKADSNLAVAAIVVVVVFKDLHSLGSFQFDSSLQGVEFAAHSRVFTSPQV